MNALRVSLFGQMQIIYSGHSSPIKIQHNGQALLAYLLLQPQRLCSRDEVLDAFWGEQSQNSARKCLNTAIWRLRSIFKNECANCGSFLVTTSDGEVGFNWEADSWIDIHRFTATIEPILHIPLQVLQPKDITAVEEAFMLYQGELLEGFYEDWVLYERERLRRLYLNSLAHMMYYYAQHNDVDQSLAYGQRILDRDPLRETIHRHMMYLYAESGHRALAVRQFEICRQVLDQELGLPPTETTLDLFQKIAGSSGQHRRYHSTATDFATRQEALRDLQLAIQRVNEAHDLLEHAIQLVQSTVAPSDDQTAE